MKKKIEFELSKLRNVSLLSFQIKRIRVDTTRGMKLTPKKEDFRENVLKLGHLADYLLQGMKTTRF